MAKDNFEKMRDYIDKLTDLNLSLAQKARDRAAETYGSTLITILAVTAAGLVLGVFIMWAMSRAVTRPLRAVIEGLAEDISFLPELEDALLHLREVDLRINRGKHTTLLGAFGCVGMAHYSVAHVGCQHMPRPRRQGASRASWP